ncbi:hypothetical protein ACJX0J_038933, partial [Zea mays]
TKKQISRSVVEGMFSCLRDTISKALLLFSSASNNAISITKLAKFRTIYGDILIRKRMEFVISLAFAKLFCKGLS